MSEDISRSRDSPPTAEGKLSDESPEVKGPLNDDNMSDADRMIMNESLFYEELEKIYGSSKSRNGGIMRSYRMLVDYERETPIH